MTAFIANKSKIKPKGHLNCSITQPAKTGFPPRSLPLGDNINLWNIFFSRRSIWVLLELVRRWKQHLTKIDSKKIPGKTMKLWIFLNKILHNKSYTNRKLRRWGVWNYWDLVHLVHVLNVRRQSGEFESHRIWNFWKEILNKVFTSKKTWQ